MTMVLCGGVALAAIIGVIALILLAVSCYMED